MVSISESRPCRNAEGTPLARRDIVVAVRRRPIALVEEILAIELRPPGLVDLRVDGGIEANEAGEPDRIVAGGKGIAEIEDAEPGTPHLCELVFVPPCELVVGHKLNTIAGHDGCRRRA